MENNNFKMTEIRELAEEIRMKVYEYGAYCGKMTCYAGHVNYFQGKDNKQCLSIPYEALKSVLSKHNQEFNR